jgi:hypothetical protein
MGMYGEWLRVTPAELERAKADLDWARELAAKAEEDDTADDGDMTTRRSFGTDKTWHALDYLLGRRGFPVSIVFGEETFGDDADEAETDWGYGPQRYLTPEQVQRAAVELVPLSGEQLIDGVMHFDLVAEHIYPAIWDSPDELEWAVSGLAGVKAYFAAAAQAGDAIICWIG